MPFSKSDTEKNYSVHQLKTLVDTLALDLNDETKLRVRFNASQLDAFTTQVNDYFRENGVIKDGQELSSQELLNMVFNSIRSDDMSLENTIQLIEKMNEYADADNTDFKAYRIDFSHKRTRYVEGNGYETLSKQEIIGLELERLQKERKDGACQTGLELGSYAFIPGGIATATVLGHITGVLGVGIVGGVVGAVATIAILALGFKNLAKIGNFIQKNSDQKKLAKVINDQIIAPREKKAQERKEAFEKFETGLTEVFDKTLRAPNEDDLIMLDKKATMPALQLRFKNTHAYKQMI